MRNNSSDLTLDRNYVQKWRFLISEYETVKAGRSERYGRVGEFYKAHGTCSQTFRKYYNRYLQNPIDGSLGATEARAALEAFGCAVRSRSAYCRTAPARSEPL